MAAKYFESMLARGGLDLSVLPRPESGNEEKGRGEAIAEKNGTGEGRDRVPYLLATFAINFQDRTPFLAVRYHDHERKGKATLTLNPLGQVKQEPLDRFLQEVGCLPPLAALMTPLLQRLERIFRTTDAVFLEAVLNWDEKMTRAAIIAGQGETDPYALFRQPEMVAHFLAGEKIRLTPLEQQVAGLERRDPRGSLGPFKELDGTVGLIMGGYGASLMIFDLLVRLKIKPANYCDISGDLSVRKIRDFTMLLASKPRVRQLAVVGNVGVRVRADMVLRGVIKGLLEMGEDPASWIGIFRLPGEAEDEAVALGHQYGIKICDRTLPIEDALRLLVSGE